MGYDDNRQAPESVDEFQAQKDKILSDYAKRVVEIKKEILDLVRQRETLVAEAKEAAQTRDIELANAREDDSRWHADLVECKKAIERELSAFDDAKKQRVAELSRLEFKLSTRETEWRKEKEDLSDREDTLQDRESDLESTIAEYNAAVRSFEKRVEEWSAKKVADEAELQKMSDGAHAEVERVLDKINESNTRIAELNDIMEASEVERREIGIARDLLDSVTTKFTGLSEERKSLDEEKAAFKNTIEIVQGEANLNKIDRDSILRMKQDVEKRERVVKEGEAALAGKL